jgi:hypothetical protein
VKALSEPAWGRVPGEPSHFFEADDDKAFLVELRKLAEQAQELPL